MGFYIEQNDRSLKSAMPAEDIPLGTLVATGSSTGEVELAEEQNHETFEGVVEAPRRAEYIAEESDEGSDFVYKAGDQPDDLSDAGHLVIYGGNADADVIRVRTIVAEGDVGDTTPSITDGSVVGYVKTDETNGLTASNAGRIVEEGYSTDQDNATGAVTYSRANGNFVAIGRATRDGSTDFDETVRVEVNKEL